MHTYTHKKNTTQKTFSKSTMPRGRMCIEQKNGAKVVLQLQRMIGNQAIQRLLHEITGTPEMNSVENNKLTGFDQDITRIPEDVKGYGNMQSKPNIGIPSDLSLKTFQVGIRHALSALGIQSKYTDYKSEKYGQIPIRQRLEADLAYDSFGHTEDPIIHGNAMMKVNSMKKPGTQYNCLNNTSTDQVIPHRIVVPDEDTIEESYQSGIYKIRDSISNSSIELDATTSKVSNWDNSIHGPTVRLHRGDRTGQFNRKLNTKALTYRNHIRLGRIEDHRQSFTLTHGLVHVQQQTSPGVKGPVSPLSAPPSIQRNLTPPGNCIQGIHDQLQRLVKAWCDHPSGRECTGTESCHRLQQKIRRNQLCAQHRRTINDRCYAGGDVGHRIAERDARRAQRTCMMLFRTRCSPRPPVPVPEEVARRIARWARDVLRSGRNAFDAAGEFLRDHPELVGMIIAAGVIAIIVLIADDATLVGIADDVLIPIIAALEWVALRMSFGF